MQRQHAGKRNGGGNIPSGVRLSTPSNANLHCLSMTQRSTYHHGNLRAELIRCGKELLGTEGIHNLSLRAVTRAVGVSHGAPRNQFPDLNSLLAAIAAEGFDELVALREKALTRHKDPARRLKAILGTYIDFATENPDLFWLMYGSHIKDRHLYEDLNLAGGRSYALLERCVYDYLQSIDLPKGCKPELVQCAWSAVHGMSMLFNNRPGPSTVPTAMSFADWKEAVIKFALTGLKARASEIS